MHTEIGKIEKAPTFPVDKIAASLPEDGACAGVCR
jgi:hypothetical protein